MRELRTCPVTGVTVLLHDAWPDRPLPAVAPEGPCWACDAPGPVLVRRGEVVAVPHPTPALGIEGEVRVRVGPVGVRRDAVGAHELVFGAHDGANAPLLTLAAERIADLRGDTRLRGFALTRDAVPGAHVQWQLFALPTDRVIHEARAWRDAERAEGTRVIAQAHGAIAIAAWAPVVPFETWIAAKAGALDFPANILEISVLAERLIVALHSILGGAHITMTAEWGEPWRLVLKPVVSSSVPTASIGIPGHGVPPERAAHLLRQELLRW